MMASTVEDEVSALNQRVAELQRSGEISEGRRLADKAFSLALEKLPKGSFLLAQSARNRAIMATMDGDQQEGIKILVDAFDFYKVALEVARSERKSFQESGRFRDARAAAANVVRIARTLAEMRESFGMHGYSEVTESAIALASLDLEIGDIDDAAQAVTEAEQALRHSREDEHPLAILVLQLKARLAREQGRLEEAKQMYTRALEIAEHSGAPVLDIASCNANLGFACQALGEVAEAEAYIRKAVELTKNSDDRDIRVCCSVFISNLADLYCSIGQLDRAVESQREALEIDKALLSADDRTYALHRFNLGIFLAQHGQHAEAYKLIGGASRILSRDFDPGGHRFAWLYTNAATALVLEGRFKEAEMWAVFASDTVRKNLGKDNPRFADALRLLGWISSRRGKYEHALGVLRRAREINRRLLPTEHPQQAETLRDLFVALAGLGEEDEAFSVLKDFYIIESARLGSLLRLGVDADRLQVLSRMQQDVAIAISFVLRYRQDDANATRWLYDLILRRKGLSAEAAIGQRETILGNRYPAFRHQLERLGTLRAKAARMMLDRSYDLTLDDYRQELDAVRAEANDIERQLSREIPETDLRRKLEEADTAHVAAALPAEGVLVEFVRFEEFRFAVDESRGELRWGPACYAAFVLKAGEPESIELVRIGEAGLIDEEVSKHRTWVTGEDQSRGSTEANTRLAFSDVLGGISALVRGRRRGAARTRGQALHALILDPVLLPNTNPKQLIIAADGALCWLPFECLFDKAGPLIDRVGISYIGCGRDVLSFSTKQHVTLSPPIIVADPDYELQGEGVQKEHVGRHSYDFRKEVEPFRRLEGTREEGNAIAGILGVKPTMGPDATEHLIKECRSPYVLHVATHGFFFEATGRIADKGGIGRFRYSEDPMLRSGLALAGANSFQRGKPLPDAAEDGILTSRDIGDLDLRGTKLVVLSACDTGLGVLQPGEGVFGLRRAFWLAGARAMIVSLWKVDDRHTTTLMTQLYQKFAQGIGPVEALRYAQQEMRKKRPDPYYWAAFVFIGDPTLR